MRIMRDKKGQAIMELAVCGALILFCFGIFLSYAQRLSDQQYVQMEGFRRALEKACIYSNPNGGAGAAVQMVRLENRQHVDLSGSYMKGNTQILSSSANVFWAVPRVEEGSEAPNMIYYRVNEDEKEANYRHYISKDHDSTDSDGHERQKYWVFEPGENTTTDTRLAFNETSSKIEDGNGITNIKNSTMQNTFHINVPFKIKEVDKDDEDYERELSMAESADPNAPLAGASREFLDYTQHVYCDTDGQYKYSTTAPTTGVIRARTWQTNF